MCPAAERPLPTVQPPSSETAGQDRGLTEAQAAALLASEGPNELPASQRRTLLRSVLDVGREPMTLLLLGCGAIYLVLGDRQEALMLLGFVAFIAVLTLYQERKTEHAVEALRDLTSPRALVIRGGERRRIAGREVVPGDLVVLAEGDRVPADAVVLSTSECATDESLLTGEPVPVRKRSWDGRMEFTRPGGDDLPFVYSGTLVVRGAALARAVATGARAEIGRIGQALRAVESEETPLQRETRRLVARLAVGAGVLSICVVFAYAILRHSWLDGLLAGLTLAMAILPNEFPVVVTMFLALGAWRLSRRRVLTRRIPAVETIGSATVLCVDKTGTLTQNRMTVRRLIAGDRSIDLEAAGPPLPEPFHEMIEVGILASRPDPFDPMEVAFHRLGQQQLVEERQAHPGWELVREYPLTPKLLAVTHVWKRPDERLVVATKGAPEAVAALCALDPAATAAVQASLVDLARDGLRVLAVARGLVEEPLPATPEGIPLRYLGLVALEDPIRPSVSAAVRECQSAGIRVAIVSGDYAATVQGIARQVGIGPLDDILTGQELEALSDDALRRRVKEANLFARVMPEQKLRLVEAFKANGEIVAMTGDGVNDAPALKAAHIGIAMGGRGTDVAREASLLVLLDDDFASVEMAVRLGRRILDNLRKALAYILAIHLPILGLTIVPILAGWPLVLLPIHIAFLHLIIDPACSVVFEAETEEADVMRRPPRPPREPLFGRRLLVVSALQGASVLLVLLLVFATAHYRGLGDLEARALTFTTLIVANLGLILVNRSWSAVAAARSGNAALRWVIAATIAFLGAVLYAPPLRAVFRFARLHALDLAICVAAGALSVGWFEVRKIAAAWLSRRRRAPEA